MASGSVPPATAFSLLLRLCFEVRPIDHTKGSNLPILMVLHVVVQLRRLAGVTTLDDTNALVSFLTNSFRTVSVTRVTTLLAKGLKVPDDKLDVAERVAVR